MRTCPEVRCIVLSGAGIAKDIADADPASMRISKESWNVDLEMMGVGAMFRYYGQSTGCGGCDGKRVSDCPKVLLKCPGFAAYGGIPLEEVDPNSGAPRILMAEAQSPLDRRSVGRRPGEDGPPCDGWPIFAMSVVYVGAWLLAVIPLCIWQAGRALVRSARSS